MIDVRSVVVTRTASASLASSPPAATSTSERKSRVKNGIKLVLCTPSPRPTLGLTALTAAVAAIVFPPPTAGFVDTCAREMPEIDVADDAGGESTYRCKSA